MRGAGLMPMLRSQTMKIHVRVSTGQSDQLALRQLRMSPAAAVAPLTRRSRWLSLSSLTGAFNEKRSYRQLVADDRVVLSELRGA